MSKLGFTFYPKDWWTSDTFFNLEAEERYIYLECVFFMYQNNGYLELSREQIEARLRTKIKPNIWTKITQVLTKTDLGYTHSSVTKRNSKAMTSRENGKKGGRPKKPKNPPNNPPLEVNIKEIEYKVKKKEINFDKLLLFINEKTKRNFKVINSTIKSKYKARLNDGYSNRDILTAIENSVISDYHKETNFKYLTPEFFSRATTIDKYSNTTNLAGSKLGSEDSYKKDIDYVRKLKEGTL